MGKVLFTDPLKPPFHTHTLRDLVVSTLLLAHQTDKKCFPRGRPTRTPNKKTKFYATIQPKFWY